MRTNAIIRIVAFSISILILIGILGSSLGFSFYTDNARVHSNHAPTESVLSQETFTTDIKNIEIDWVAGSITISANPNLDTIYVYEHMSNDVEYKMVCKQNGQTLKIEFDNGHERLHLFGNNQSVSKDLHISVPSDWFCNSLEIDAAATDVQIDNLRIRQVDFEGASGCLILDHCDVDILDIETASGDVSFNGMLNELDFNAASATFEGDFLTVPQKLDLEAMSGDMTVILPEDSGFYLELDTMSGSFDSDFDFRTTGDHFECGDGACRIRISAVSGDVNILKGIASQTTTTGKNCNH